MNLGDVLDGAFKLYLADWRTLMIVTGVVLAPLELISAFLQRDLLGGVGLLELLGNPEAAAAFDPAGSVGSYSASVLRSLVSVVILPFIAGAVSKVISASYLGRSMPPGEALRAAARRWWSLTWSWLMAHALQLLPYAVAGAVLGAGIVAEITPLAVTGVLLFLPAILGQMVIIALFVAVAPVLVIEELGPMRAMRRSAGLMRPRLWHVLGAAILSGLLAGVLSGVLGGIPLMLTLLLGPSFGWVITALAGIVAGLLTTPFVAIVATLLYFDARIRREGFDLEVLAGELGAHGGVSSHEAGG
jgi:hypothetical protein